MFGRNHSQSITVFWIGYWVTISFIWHKWRILTIGKVVFFTFSTMHQMIILNILFISCARCDKKHFTSKCKCQRRLSPNYSIIFCKRDRSTFTYPHLLQLIYNFKKLPSNLWFSNCMYTTHILQIVIPQLEKWFLNCKCWASKLQPCNLKIANDGKRPSPQTKWHFAIHKSHTAIYNIGYTFSINQLLYNIFYN